MNLTFSVTALAQLSQQRERAAGKNLKLVYDAEGCGCAVSGVAQMKWVREIGDESDRIADGPLPAYVEKRQMVFFEDHLHLDYHHERRVYRLSSPNQTYNASMIIQP